MWGTYKNCPLYLGYILKHIILNPLISFTTVKEKGRGYIWKFSVTREISSNNMVVRTDEVTLPVLQSHIPLALP